MSEYQDRAKTKAENLQAFSDIPPNVENFQNDLNGRGSFILSRMMARVSVKGLKEKLDKEKLVETFNKLDEIVKDERFKKDFKDLKVDKDKKKIYYESENKFKFVALLADRPSQTLFLGRKFME
ncbi:hypothetical protein GNF18_10450 [Ligilactobacillus pobuzihii]|uniref:hypothetical protein n=1 Tax=Ligilactobacillus pobuzihii TaxID=449659 RepID=UPI0019CF8D99|nr:hypothetical protein [Ligilactobacillus pobuzihii]MBN7275561.1 hypothetical protein [Ligilactobacillus pobuzihii]